MTSKMMMCFFAALLLGVLPLYGDTNLSISGTWNEVYGSGGAGSPDGTIDANMTGSGFELILAEAVHQGVMSSPPAVPGVYVTDYVVSSSQPATLIADDGCMNLSFSNMILNVTSEVTATPATFTMTSQAIDDSGCYCLEVSLTGVVDPNLVTSTGQGGTLSGSAKIKPLTFSFTGSWGEIYGSSGAGSAGGTISANMTDSDWDVNLPSAIHQGVTSGPDPWLTDYVVDVCSPATITNTALGIDLTYSTLTLAVSSYTNASSPYFRMQVSGVDDSGLVSMSICAVGEISTSATTPYDLSGSLSGGCQLTFSLPQGSTHSAKSVKATTAKLSGAIVSDGGYPCQVRYHYSIDGGSIMTTSWKNISLVDFTPITDLTPDTTYSYLMESKNCAGNHLGQLRSFTTLASIDISSTEGGDVVDPGEGVYEMDGGTIIEISAVTEETHSFVGWSGSAVDSGLVADANSTTTTVDVSGGLTLTANFEAKPAIIWVADNLKYDFDTNEPSDIGFVNLLRDQGYYVDYKGEYMPHEPNNDSNALNPDWLYWRELDPNKITELEAADLIIMGRVVSSGCYDDTNEAEMWNAISTPIVSQSAHVSRAYSKWGWFNTTGTTNKTPRLMQAVDLDHDIFAGVPIDPNGNVDLVDPNAQVSLPKLNEGSVAGNGVLLGLHDEGYPWIVVWESGVEYYDGSGQIAGGPRMFLGVAAGKTMNEFTEGGYNLTADGQTVFLNAVEYMIAGAPLVQNASFERPGTEKLQNWEDVPAWSSDTVAVDSGVEQGWGATDGEWTGFLKAADSSIWQTTSHILSVDDVLTLSVNAQNNWLGTTVELILYVEDANAVRQPLAIADCNVSDTMGTFSVTAKASDTPDLMGLPVGVEIDHVTVEDDSWIGFDEVGLTVEYENLLMESSTIEDSTADLVGE